MPVIVTVCGTFQLVLLNNRLAGETGPSATLLGERPMVTAFPPPPPGLLLSWTVNVAVPPFSVVTRPEVGVTVMPAGRLPGPWVKSLGGKGETGRAGLAPADAASSTQSPPRPVMLVEANTRAPASWPMRSIRTCPSPSG